MQSVRNRRKVGQVGVDDVGDGLEVLEAHPGSVDPAHDVAPLVPDGLGHVQHVLEEAVSVLDELSFLGAIGHGVRDHHFEVDLLEPLEHWHQRVVPLRLHS